MFDISFELVTPSADAAKLILQWRNDPETLKWSFNKAAKIWPAFFSEFQKDYVADPTLPCFFILYDGLKIGFIRFRKFAWNETTCKKSIDISINITSEQRGKGFGKSTLMAVTQQLSGLLRGFGYSSIVAEIFDGNVNSIKAFEHAGFKFIGKYEKFTNTALILRYEFELISQTSGAKEEKGLPIIGDGHPCFIIAEAGSNWRMGTYKRDLKMAFTLIDLAKEAGCDAVKFQTYRAETTYVKEAGESDYLSDNGIKDDISEIFKDLSMPYEMLGELSNYAQKNDIIFMSSPFSTRDLSEVDNFAPLHKIASYEITHCRLIDAAADTGKPLILSTGASAIPDIRQAIERFRNRSTSPLYLMQCTAKYPSPFSSLNLNVIPQLKTMFGIPVGLSDHSRDPIIGPVCATALGANLIEKHYTLNNDLPGPDHKFAITAVELKSMVAAVRNAEKSLGQGIKKVLDEEQELYSFARRALQAICDIPAGTELEEGKNFDILRPGKQKQGMNPMQLESLESLRVKRTIPSGDGIQLEDLEV